MIPIGSNISDAEFVEINEPSLTYQLDFSTGRVVGMIDGLESVRQYVTKALITKRFEHDIYTPDYASELQRLAGKELIFVQTEVRRLVTEALLVDDRIIRVDNFIFTSLRDELSVSFLVHTIFGNLQSEVQLNV